MARAIRAASQPPSQRASVLRFSDKIARIVSFDIWLCAARQNILDDVAVHDDVEDSAEVVTAHRTVLGTSQDPDQRRRPAYVVAAPANWSPMV